MSASGLHNYKKWFACKITVSYCVDFVQGATHDSTIAEMKDMDNVLIILKFPSSLISAIDLSRHATYGYDQRVEVRFQKTKAI